MFIRLYLYAQNDNDAKDIYDDCVSQIADYIVEKDGLKVEQYWKFSDMYVVEESIKFNIDVDEFQTFLKSISDSWLQFGYPETDELLASETDSGKYMKNKISMVNLFFDDEELFLLSNM